MSRENGERNVVAHREHGLLRALDHRREYHVQFFQRDAVDDLLAGEIEGCEIDFRYVGGGRDEFPEFYLMLVDPAAIWLLLGKLVLNLMVVFELTGRGVRRDHLAGSKASFADDGRVIKNDGTGFRADVEDAVLRDFVT